MRRMQMWRLAPKRKEHVVFALKLLEEVFRKATADKGVLDKAQLDMDRKKGARLKRGEHDVLRQRGAGGAGGGAQDSSRAITPAAAGGVPARAHNAPSRAGVAAAPPRRDPRYRIYGYTRITPSSCHLGARCVSLRVCLPVSRFYFFFLVLYFFFSRCRAAELEEMDKMLLAKSAMTGDEQLKKMYKRQSELRKKLAAYRAERLQAQQMNAQEELRLKAVMQAEKAK